MATFRKGYKYTFGFKDNQAIRARANAKKIVCLENGEIYESIREASTLLKLNYAKVSKNANGRGDKVNGYSFEFVKN